jgi:hypothetical protein
VPSTLVEHLVVDVQQHLDQLVHVVLDLEQHLVEFVDLVHDVLQHQQQHLVVRDQLDVHVHVDQLVDLGHVHDAAGLRL